MNRIKYAILLILTLAAAGISTFAQDPDIERLQRTDRLIEKVNAIPLEFQGGSPELVPAGTGNVQKQAVLLKQLPPGTVVEIGVHTFAVGGDDHNALLTQMRAEKIRSMLVAAGIPAAGLTAKGYGSSKPVTANAADNKNGRVEYLVIKSASPGPSVSRSNLAAPNPAPSASAIVAGRGWGNVRIGSTREEVEAALGKPEYFENSSFPPNESYGSYYRKGIVAVYQTEGLRVIHLRFIGDGQLYASGSLTFGSCQGQPDKGLAWKTSVAEVTRAYGAPLKREAYNEYKTKIEIVHLTYPGAEFLFKGDKLFQINIAAGGPGANIEPAGQDQTAGVMKAVNKDAEALFDAVHSGSETAVRDLIKRGAGLNFERKDETPLILAIRDKKTDIAKLLLEAGADPNFAESMNGGTPLRWAVQMGNVEMVEMLINHYNVDVNFRPKNGVTALHTAADFNRDERITVMLLAAGSDPNVIDEEGRSPLDLAIMGRKGAIAPLLEKATNPRVITRLKKEYAARPKAP
jgi:hypothetical protein